MNPNSRRTLGALTIAALSMSTLTISVAAYAAATVGQTITTEVNQVETSEGTVTNPDGTIQAITAYTTNIVTLLPTADKTPIIVSDPNKLLSGPVSAVFSTDGSLLYVTNWTADTVVIIDVDTATVTGSFTADLHSEIADNNTGIALSPDGRLLVITNNQVDDNIAAFDTTNNYGQVAHNTLSSGYNINLFFTNNTTVLAAATNGTLQTFTTNDGLVGEPKTVESNRYWCMNQDGTLLATAFDADTETEATGFLTALLVNPITGEVIDSLPVSEAEDLTNCAFTLGGQVLFTDFNYNENGNGQVFALDTNNNELSLLAKYTLPNLEYTTSINVMSNCEVYVPGYSTNIGVLLLDSAWCSAPADSNTAGGSTVAPQLAATGESATPLLVALGLLLSAGTALMFIRKRRSTN